MTSQVDTYDFLDHTLDQLQYLLYHVASLFLTFYNHVLQDAFLLILKLSKDAFQPYYFQVQFLQAKLLEFHASYLLSK